SSPQRIAVRLRRMGIDIDPDHVYTAAAATADYLLEEFGSKVALSSAAQTQSCEKPRVFNLSTEGIEEMLEGKVQWVQSDHEACDVVICGVPLNVYATEPRQRTAMLLLRNGAALVGICADRVYPSPRGLEFGVGAMAAMLSYASGVAAVFCGKPERLFFNELCHRLGV